MYPIILEELRQTIKVSKRELEADIKDIAEYWETCLEKACIVDRDMAILLLNTCVNCYLRGRGIRLGNFQMMKRNSSVLLALVTLIPLYAWDQDQSQYPKIFELIPINKKVVRDTLNGTDILTQAEKILQDKWEF